MFNALHERCAIVETLFDDFHTPASALRPEYFGGLHHHVGAVDRCAATVIAECLGKLGVGLINAVPNAEVVAILCRLLSDNLLNLRGALLEIVSFKLLCQRFGTVGIFFCLLQLRGFLRWRVGVNAIAHLIQLLLGLRRRGIGNLLLRHFRFSL